MSDSDVSASRGINFSHVQAHFVGAVYCPDCEAGGKQLVMMQLPKVENVLQCGECGAEFLRPQVTLERVPPDDYTSG